MAIKVCWNVEVYHMLGYCIAWTFYTDEWGECPNEMSWIIEQKIEYTMNVNTFHNKYICE